MLGDPCQHARPYFVAVMECKDVIWKTWSLKDAMRP